MGEQGSIREGKQTTGIISHAVDRTGEIVVLGKVAVVTLVQGRQSE
jgi:hypothetical protein